ncbi:uncharacterized protein NP_3576A [Natronomonas pharaonis DSM 2160]|uniref:Uncharacterized protein n=1 Tax=Natronomonas pharaonis (strain ATCC 35678 / DSM 2160 / CIP 103997 / JCM 8858 / NBRC 14720 / NCIMB 2260 / Gabara) TaxID=348780 RepID=A0A1U7EXH0_NATPD|nr:uncharacterized protein NP_3576A [Natronomonas pharaonis DSM 2160]
MWMEIKPKHDSHSPLRPEIIPPPDSYEIAGLETDPGSFTTEYSEKQLRFNIMMVPKRTKRQADLRQRISEAPVGTSGYDIPPKDSGQPITAVNAWGVSTHGGGKL